MASSAKRPDLGNPASAFGDDGEVEDGQDYKHHNADRVIAANEEVTERFNYLAGGVRSGVAFGQHHALRRTFSRTNTVVHQGGPN
jgi:hypothetical protein